MACRGCYVIITVGLNCSVCNRFKMCIPCYEKYGHAHAMNEYVMVLCDIVPLPERRLMIALQSGELTVRQYIPILLMAYQNQEGSDGMCDSLLKHIKSTGFMCNCTYCKQMFLLYRHHSTTCKDTNCCTTNCSNITEKLLKKRLAETNAHAIEQKLLKGYLPVHTATAAVTATSCETSNSSTAGLMLARKFTIQRCVRTLVHACHCLESDCMPVSCHKMKRILSHIKICKRRINGGCTICRQLTTLCCYHAKICKETKCSVLLCSAIKRKMQQSKIEKAASKV